MSGTRWVVFVVGLWILVSAFFGFGDQGFLWSDLLSGIVVFFAGLTFLKESLWEGWSVLVLGAWMVVAAFITGLHGGSALYWNNILVGAVITLLGIVPAGQHTGPQPHAA